ncbi:MAG: hypothetical protein K2M72_08965 [Paramuribaculum sp.]|nr:hypothetical protein [Paramuribaculum sp.]
MKTVIKFKPCNVGTAEVHSRRDRAYCEAVARKFGHTYFWDEYRHLNHYLSRSIRFYCSRYIFA